MIHFKKISFLKKIISVLAFGVLFLFSANTFAQNFALGIRGGISIPNLTAGKGEDNPLNSGYKSRLGPDLGIFAECKVSTIFTIQPMLEYSSQGGKKNGFQAFATPTAYTALFPPNQAPAYLYANFKSEARLNYLLLPVLAKFGWNFHHTSALRFYADAGPYVGLLLSAKQLTTGSSNIYADSGGQQPLTQAEQSFDNTTDIKSQLHSGNFGFEANVGFSYTQHGNNIFIEGGGNYGIVNIQKGTANGKNNAGAGTVNIGITHWFGKS
jgi:hypothetical protein